MTELYLPQGLTTAQKEKYDVLFPPFPRYGPPTIGNRIYWGFLRVLSFCLYMTGLYVVVLAVIFTLIKNLFAQEPERPFREEETKRAEEREKEDLDWEIRGGNQDAPVGARLDSEMAERHGGWIPTEGGKDKMLRDVGYYARRVGLDCEEVKVQTEDGHVLLLWHVYDPREYVPLPDELRGVRGPESIDSIRPPSRMIQRKPPMGANVDNEKRNNGTKKYPVLMIHGLLQSAGVYATNDEHSLAFWLCKEGFDVWLGNCRAGFVPEHIELEGSNPEMWNWDLRHMATLDLPALTARILSETSSPKLALVGHSQGTTATLIALSRFGRPSLSSKLSVACLLAPAFYAGSLLTTKFHFRIMRLISKSFFTLLFGLTSFLPAVVATDYFYGKVPDNFIGWPSYVAYKWMFDWTDHNWDRGVRNRNFLFAPTYISARCMAWWLGRGGFADRGCVLNTKEETERERIKDLLDDYDNVKIEMSADEVFAMREKLRVDEEKGLLMSECWYPENTAPLAMWIAEDDELVDGNRLLDRFKRGREPNVTVVHEHVVRNYQHLDVVWSCDVIQRIGWELREVIWRSIELKDGIRIPKNYLALDEKGNSRVEEPSSSNLIRHFTE